jgi:hypothetical protein
VGSNPTPSATIPIKSNIHDEIRHGPADDPANQIAIVAHIGARRGDGLESAEELPPTVAQAMIEAGAS